MTYLVVSTQLKSIRQIGSFPQVEVKMKHIRNHLPWWHVYLIDFPCFFLPCSHILPPMTSILDIIVSLLHPSKPKSFQEIVRSVNDVCMFLEVPWISITNLDLSLRYREILMRNTCQIYLLLSWVFRGEVVWHGQKFTPNAVLVNIDLNL